MLQLAIIFLLAIGVFALERLRPARKLPPSKNWYVRATCFNLFQLSLVWIAGVSWIRWFQGVPLLHLTGNIPPILQGFLFWLLGTFVFYWWHRLRHLDWWWRIFHQIHHSPTRIEMLTSFYKHPLEITANSIIISAIVYGVFGASVEVGAWYNVFAVTGEFFYHMNVRTPHWIGYFLQRPEHHSIHHERGVHEYNFGDITLWDRLFGTFKDTNTFAADAGFAENKEEKVSTMLKFKDVQK